MSIIAAAMLAGAIETQVLARHESASLAANIQRDRASFYNNLLDLRSARMKAVTFDDTHSDDMVKFAEHPTAKWAQVNLATSLPAYDLDCIWVFNPSMKCVYSVASSQTHSLIAPPFDRVAISRLRNASEYYHFYVETADGLMEIRGSSIHPSGDLMHHSAPKGYFFVGRIWDPAYQAEIAGITGTQLAIRTYDAQDANPDTSGLKDQRVLPGWDGKPVGTLVLTGYDNVSPVLERSSAKFVVMMDVSAILFLVGVTICLYVWVSRPIGRLCAAISKQSLAEIGDIANDKAEMGRLAALIGDFFKQTHELMAAHDLLEIRVVERTKELAESNRKLKSAYGATIEGWSRALDLRDHETEGHSERVTAMTLVLARYFIDDDEELIDIERGALLHDIGKMGIPDQILRKPGALTDEEWVIMRKHPEFARQMLQPITFLRPALDIPYCHHEKWDGTGYPQGLIGEEIPLAARIFAVADVWDALASDRPYRRAWPLIRVREHIAALSGSHFDPRVVARLLEETEYLAEEQPMLKAA